MLANAAGARRLLLHEHRTTPGVELTRGEVDALLASPAGLAVTPTRGRPGHYDLRPGSKVGLLAAGDLALEIRPKVPVERLLFLLSFGMEHARWEEQPVRADSEQALTEALVELYTRLLQRALARGLRQGYRSVDESLPGVRGRLRLDDQLRHRFGLAPPVEVRFDDYTEDIEPNRVLKAALLALGRVARSSQRSRSALRRTGQLLQRVSTVEYPPGRVPHLAVDRLSAHYEPALRLAELILENASTSLAHGSTTSVSLLFDMNQVFESFVRRALRAELGLDARSFPSPRNAPPLFLDEARQLRLLPDLSWWQSGRCRFVGDVKYKCLEDGGVRPGDVYQMLAYLMATGLREGVLVYAGEGAKLNFVSAAAASVNVCQVPLGSQMDCLRTTVMAIATIRYGDRNPQH